MAIYMWLVEEFVDWFSWVLRAIPGRSGRLIRSFVYKFCLNRSGKPLSIAEGVVVRGFKNISLGSEIFIASEAAIHAAGKDTCLSIGSKFALNSGAKLIADLGVINIGNGVMIGPNVVIRSSNHGHYSVDIPIWDQETERGVVTIGDDVWIGANAVILPNVTLGKGCIIAAGAVVTKSTPPFSIVGGVPAKVIRNRLNASERT